MAGILDQYRLDGKVALVTGAGKGIGAGIAVALAEAGADVAVTARTKEDIEAVAKQVRELGHAAVAIPGDVTDHAGLPHLVDETVSALGGLDIVVNNAGGTDQLGTIQTTTVASLELHSTSTCRPRSS